MQRIFPCSATSAMLNSKTMEDYGGTGKENVTYRSLYTTSKIVKDSGDTDLETQDDPIKTIENRK